MPKYTIILNLSIEAVSEEEAYRQVAFSTLDSLNDGESLEVRRVQNEH